MSSSRWKKYLLFVSVAAAVVAIYKFIRGKTMEPFKYVINKTWDGNAIPSSENVEMILERNDNSVRMYVKAPFANSPGSPAGKSGEPFNQLWDYEVVEAFFLSDNGQYLEVELCPHGQYLVLLLNGRRKKVKDLLPLEFTSHIQGTEWTGTADIPIDYFPPKVSKCNAYAIRGSDDARTYYSLYSVPGIEPDFHRLEYFQEINFQKLVPENSAPAYTSPYWNGVVPQS